MKRPDRDLLCLLPAAPIAACCTSLRESLLLSMAFCIITALTVLLSALIPRRLPRSVRTVLYSVTGSLVYIPAALICFSCFPDLSMGIWIPLLAAAVYLNAAHDEVFPKGHLLKPLLTVLAGGTAAALLSGLLRELLASGTVWGKTLLPHPPLPVLLEPSAGLMLLVLFAVIFGAFRQAARKEDDHADRG